MALGDIYELIDKQLLDGQQVLNVYFYRHDNVLVAVTAQDLIDSYVGQVLPDVVALQSTDLLHTEISARNLFDESDRAVNAISVPGTGVSEYANTFSSIGYSLIQDNGAVRNGAKRYGGIPEAASDDGVISGAGYIALLNTLAAILSGTLDFGIIATWLPVIVKRIAEVGGGYRLPETQAEAVYGAVTDAQYSPLITSQVSRKIGIGV